jgi:hypothetical protein
MSAAPRPEPTRYDIPRDAVWVKCRSCGVAIVFVETSKGRRMPVTQEGISHFIDCPGAATHRRRK